MRIFVGTVCAAAWILYFGQLISAVKFKLAQRLGLQESPQSTDALTSHLELWAARWDLVWLWTLPAAGTLILLDHAWWPFAALIGGAASIDTGGREAAKIRGLQERGVCVGTAAERRLSALVYVYLIGVGLLLIVTAMRSVVSAAT